MGLFGYDGSQRLEPLQAQLSCLGYTSQPCLPEVQDTSSPMVFPNNKMLEAHGFKKTISCSTLYQNPVDGQARNKIGFAKTTAGRNDTKTDPDTKDEEKIKRDDEEGDQDAEDAEVCDVRYQLESLACTILHLKFENLAGYQWLFDCLFWLIILLASPSLFVSFFPSFPPYFKWWFLHIGKLWGWKNEGCECDLSHGCLIQSLGQKKSITSEL